MSEAGPLRELPAASAEARVAEARVESPPAHYAGRPRSTQLEYEAILANASIGIAFTRERQFFLCNQRFAEMFGYAPDELIGQPGELVYPSRESYAALGEIAVPMLSQGRQLDVEWQVCRKDGSTFLVRMIAKALSAGSPQQGTVWIVEDITEKRRHADELARVLREQEAILGNASIGIVFVKERRIVRCNRRYEEMYGYGPGELEGRPTALLYPDMGEHARAAEVYGTLARGETSRRIERRRRKDGSLFWNRADGRAVDPRDPYQGSVWIVEDITDQRRAEEELQRVLAEQQALLDNVVVGIQFTRERRTVRCNRRFEELFGYAPGAAVSAPTRDLYFTDEEYRNALRAYDEIDQGRVHTREQWLRRQDGSGFWCRISGRAVQPGEPARGYVWLLEDVTERRRADQALERLVREQNAVLDNSLLGIAFIRDGRVVRANRRFEELFGGELPIDERFRVDAETPPLERLHRRRDGAELWYSMTGRAVQPGEPAQGAVWLFQDVTQQRAAEQRIERAAAEQELILDNASVGIAFVRARVIQRCNRFLEEMVRAGPGELLGQSSAILFASREDWQLAGGQAYGNTCLLYTSDAADE